MYFIFYISIHLPTRVSFWVVGDPSLSRKLGPRVGNNPGQGASPLQYTHTHTHKKLPIKPMVWGVVLWIKTRFSLSEGCWFKFHGFRIMLVSKALNPSSSSDWLIVTLGINVCQIDVMKKWSVSPFSSCSKLTQPTMQDKWPHLFSLLVINYHGITKKTGKANILCYASY